MTQVSPLKAVLFIIWVEKIECLKSRQVEYKIPALVRAFMVLKEEEIARLGLTTLLAMCVSLLPMLN